MVPVGHIDTKHLAPNYCYEAVFEKPFMIEDNGVYMIYLFPLPRPGKEDEPIAGLVCFHVLPLWFNLTYLFHSAWIGSSYDRFHSSPMMKNGKYYPICQV